MRRRERQSGVALLLVLILVASATVLGMSYAVSSTIRLISTDNLLRAGRSRYLAESGVEHGLYLLRSDPGALAGSESTLLGPFAADGTSDQYYFGSAPVSGRDGQYVLTGRATAGGITQTVALRVSVESRYKALMDSLAPIHYFRLSEQPVTDTAVDSAGYWRGTYTNDTSRGWTGAILYDDDDAPHFDGFNDYIALKVDDSYVHDVDLHGDKMTILAWVWPDTHDHVEGDRARVISKADGTDTQDHFWMIRTCWMGPGDTRFRVCLKTQGVTTGLTAESGHVPLNRWTFVAFTYDGSKMQIYHNGVQVGSCPKTGDINEDEWVPAWIGGNPRDPRARPWHGRIDEVAIWNRALSAEEIMTLYKARLPNVDKLAWNE